jgi:hypothetical protein
VYLQRDEGVKHEGILLYSYPRAINRFAIVTTSVTSCRSSYNLLCNCSTINVMVICGWTPFLPPTVRSLRPNDKLFEYGT